MSRARVGWLLHVVFTLLPLSARAQALDPQVGALQALAAASASPLEGTSALGAVRLLRLDIAATGGTPEQQATEFLSTYGAVLGQSGPDQGFVLRTIRPEGPEGQLRLASFAQTYKGIPVFGADVMVGIETSPLTGQPRVTRVSGALLPDPGLEGGVDTTPSLGPDACVAAARAFLAQPTAELLAPARLMLFDDRLFGQTPGSRLVWAVTLNPQPLPPGGGPTQVLCDADTGAVVFDQPFFFGSIDFEVGRAIIDGTPPEGWTRRFLGDESGLNVEGAAHTDANAEWSYTHWVYNYLANNYGWRGPNGNDGRFHVVVDAATGGCASFGINKYLGATLFVDPGCASYDVTAHEIGHAIITYSSKLVYQSQSGAVNEGYADAIGVSIDSADWLIGEDRTSGAGAVRDFQTPPNYSHPDRFSQYVNQMSDNGGVHTNSGILNKAHYLIATGDAFNARPAFTGIGRFKMGLLAFLGMRFVPASATFVDARAEEIWWAQTLASYAFLGFVASDVCAVKSGFAAVEVDAARGDFNCDGIDDGCVDADMDFVCAPPDNCPGVANPNQKDWDMDGDGDACDVDMDNDGHPDATDNCLNVANWDQKNTDGDSVGDACDNDDDNDDWPDGSDNCPLVWNPGQEDGDMDGIADACGDFDYDGDGWYDNDNCTFVYNGLQFDSDSDGLGDACDGCPNTADWTGAYEAFTLTPPPRPFQPDSDDDGTPDACDPMGFGAASLDLNGQPYNPGQTWVPGGAGANGAVAGPAGSRFRISIPLCVSTAAGGPDPSQIPEIVFSDLDPTVDVGLVDDDGLRIATLRPGPAGPVRGLRVRPDCSRRYLLEFSTGAAFPGVANFFVQTSFVLESSTNPWVTPGSGLPPPPPLPDVDMDGLLDTTDRCPTLFEPAGVDSDGDGVSDACDTCLLHANAPPVVPGANRTLVSGQRDDDADGRGNRCDFDYNNAGLSLAANDFNDMKFSLLPAAGLMTQNTCGATVGLPPAGEGGSGANQACGEFDHDGTGAVVSATDFNLAKAAVNAGGVINTNFPKCAACSPPWSPPLGMPGTIPVIGRPTCAGPACTYLIP